MISYKKCSFLESHVTSPFGDNDDVVCCDDVISYIIVQAFDFGFSVGVGGVGADDF